MRGPADKHTDDEIVEDIIRRVCPPKSAPLVGRIARRLISDLRLAPQSFSGNQKTNIKFAEKVHNDITRLEHTLKNAPNPLVLSRLFEERFWQIWWYEQESPISINANTKRYIAQERACQNHFAEELSQLRARCDEIIKRKPGKHHGSIKQQQADAAMASFVLLRDIASHTGTGLQLHCGPTSEFVEVARLFHEAATGDYGADLVRACRTLKASLDAKT